MSLLTPLRVREGSEGGLSWRRWEEVEKLRGAGERKARRHCRAGAWRRGRRDCGWDLVAISVIRRRSMAVVERNPSDYLGR